MTFFPAMSKERKRIFIIGGVLLLLAAVYRFWPEQGVLGDYSAALDQKKHQIIKYRKLVIKEKPLEKHLLTLTRNLERAESRLFTRSTPALSAVDLQSLINEILGSMGLQSDRTRVLKPSKIEEAPYQRIGVEVTFKADMNQFKRILYRLESSDKILAIQTLSVNAGSRRKSEPAAASIQMVVEGIMPYHPTALEGG